MKANRVSPAHVHRSLLMLLLATACHGATPVPSQQPDLPTVRVDPRPLPTTVAEPEQAKPPPCSGGLRCFELAKKVWKEERERALLMLAQSCNEGYGAACLAVAIRAKLGLDSIETTSCVAETCFGQALELFQSACQEPAEPPRRGTMATPSACRMSALMHYNGWGTEKNEREAIRLMERSCDLKDGRSCDFLVDLLEGRPDFTADRRRVLTGKADQFEWGPEDLFP